MGINSSASAKLLHDPALVSFINSMSCHSTPPSIDLSKIEFLIEVRTQHAISFFFFNAFFSFFFMFIYFDRESKLLRERENLSTETNAGLNPRNCEIMT